MAAMKGDALSWTLAVGGAAVWFASMQANFALAPWACTLQWKPALYVVSLVALGITAALGWMAWNHWRELGREYPGESGGAIASARAIASGAVLLNAMFFLVILAQAIAETILGACE